MPIYVDGKEFDNEAAAEAHFNPNIPESLKRVYIYTQDGEIKQPEGTGDNNVRDPNKVIQDMNNAADPGVIINDQGDQVDYDFSQGKDILNRRGLESPTEPDDALKPQGGTGVPGQNQSAPEPSNELPDLAPDFKDDEFVKWWRSLSPAQPDKGKVLFKTKSGIEITEGDVEHGISTALNSLSFGGVRSRLVDKPSLRLAMDAEMQGFKHEDIYKSTGWFRGADGHWRYEINDSVASYFPDKVKESPRFLEDVLSHKELFEAYPELRKIKVKINPSLGGGAQYDHSIGLIEMGPQAVKDKGILFHEIQHYIQSVENFSKGGSAGRSGRDYKLKYEEDINKLRPEFLRLQTKEMRGELLTASEQAKLDRLKTIFKNTLSMLEQETHLLKRIIYLLQERQKLGMFNQELILLNKKE